MICCQARLREYHGFNVIDPKNVPTILYAVEVTSWALSSLIVTNYSQTTCTQSIHVFSTRTVRVARSSGTQHAEQGHPIVLSVFLSVACKTPVSA